MLALPRTEIRCRAIGFFLLRARCGSGLNLPATLQLVGNFFQSAFGRRPHADFFYVPLGATRLIGQALDIIGSIS